MKDTTASKLFQTLARKRKGFPQGFPGAYQAAEDVIWDIVSRDQEDRLIRRIPGWWPTWHHMVARMLCDAERYPEHIWRRFPNTMSIDWETHQAWHKLWGNWPPGAVVAIIIGVLAPKNTFVHARFTWEWEGVVYKVDSVEACKRGFSVDICPDAWSKVFGNDHSWSAAIKRVVYRWSPVDYFREIDIIDQQGRHIHITA